MCEGPSTNPWVSDNGDRLLRAKPIRPCLPCELPRNGAEIRSPHTLDTASIQFSLSYNILWRTDFDSSLYIYIIIYHIYIFTNIQLYIYIYIEWFYNKIIISVFEAAGSCPLILGRQWVEIPTEYSPWLTMFHDARGYGRCEASIRCGTRGHCTWPMDQKPCPRFLNFKMSGIHGCSMLMVLFPWPFRPILKSNSRYTSRKNCESIWYLI